MRLWISMCLLACACLGQSPMPYQPVPGWPRLPQGWNFMETAGVAVDAGNHTYVIHRGPHPIMEFDAAGGFVQSWGDGLFVRPHSIRVDAQGNIWTTDDGAHMVLKMDHHGRIVMVLGRYRSTSESQ